MGGGGGKSADPSVAGTNGESTIRLEIQQQEDMDLAAMKAVCTLDAHCIRWMNRRKNGVATGAANVKVNRASMPPRH